MLLFVYFSLLFSHNRRQTKRHQTCLNARGANRWSSECSMMRASILPSRDRGKLMLRRKTIVNGHPIILFSSVTTWHSSCEHGSALTDPSAAPSNHQKKSNKNTPIIIFENHFKTASKKIRRQHVYSSKSVHRTREILSPQVFFTQKRAQTIGYMDYKHKKVLPKCD